jgi:hypothetical protein
MLTGDQFPAIRYSKHLGGVRVVARHYSRQDLERQEREGLEKQDMRKQFFLVNLQMQDDPNSYWTLNWKVLER